MVAVTHIAFIVLAAHLEQVEVDFVHLNLVSKIPGVGMRREAGRGRLTLVSLLNTLTLFRKYWAQSVGAHGTAGNRHALPHPPSPATHTQSLDVLVEFMWEVKVLYSQLRMLSSQNWFAGLASSTGSTRLFTEATVVSGASFRLFLMPRPSVAFSLLC